MRKQYIGAAVCGIAIFGLSTPAFAGEVTGNGKPVTIHGNSSCSFSGLEDWASAGPQPDGGISVSPGTVQNWGHVKKAFGLKGGANSVTLPWGEEGCNAHLYPNPDKP